MPPTKLYIIGNGFDIAHGIESRYADFEAFVKSTDSELHEGLAELISPEELWSDFERALEYLDTDAIIDHATNYLESYAVEDWSEAYHGDYQYEITQKIELVTVQLLQKFREWILQLQIPAQTSQRILKLDPTAIFLNFNYTSTLEALYAISPTRITYIHNKAVNNASALILGHGVAPSPPPIGSEDDDVRVQEGEEIIWEYFKETYKPTKQVILNNGSFFSNLHTIEEIFVLGHSIAHVDWPYFSEILQNIDVDKVQWHVSYYGASEMQRHMESLTSVGIPAKMITLKPLNQM